MRRFSTAAVTPTATANAVSRFTRLFQQQPIEELVELKTIQTVQRLIEQLPSHKARVLVGDEGFKRWMESYRSTNNLDPQSALDKGAFEALMKDAMAYLQREERAVLQNKPQIGVLEPEEIETTGIPYIEAISIKLAKQKCTQASKCFEHLDKDKDGKVNVNEVENLLQVSTQGNSSEWLRSQFQLYDSDGDDVVTETESKQIFDSMIETQTLVLNDIFALHVTNMPKKHMKLLERGINEENWKSKIPEKMRCVFHFAEKEDDAKKTVCWEMFKESQEAEFPELDNLLAVYAKGFYDDRQHIVAGASAANTKKEPLTPPIHELSGVLLIWEETFHAVLDKYTPLFVLFDSSARNGSLEVFREFAAAATALRLSDSERYPCMRFAMMDVTTPSRISDEYNVYGLPGLVRFCCPPKNQSNVAIATGTTAASNPTNCSMIEREIQSYRGGRTSMEFQRFMLDAPKHDVMIVSNRTSLQELVQTRAFVVLVVVDGQDNQAYMDCIALAQQDTEASTYAAAMDLSLLESDLEKYAIPVLILYRNFGETRIVYQGEWNKAALAGFIQRHKYSLISTYSNAMSGYFYDKSATAHVLIFSNPSAPYHEELVKQLEEIAYEYYDISNSVILRFLVVPPEEEVLHRALFVTANELPALLVVQNISLPSTRLMPFGDELVATMSTSTFTTIVKGFLRELFPSANTEKYKSAVSYVETKIDGQIQNRRSLVIDIVNVNLLQTRSRSIVVFFSSPRCFGCQDFFSVFDEIAWIVLQSVGDGDNLWSTGGVPLFARVNVDEVDISNLGITITSLPSVFFFPRSGDLIEFTSSTRKFTQEEILAFIYAQALA